MQKRQGKSVFESNPFANRKPPLLLRVLLQKLRREGGLKDALEVEAPPGEQFAAAPAAPDHGKPAGAANALTFHSWRGGRGEEER